MGRNVIVLAVSRDLSVFHVEGMWTSTEEGGIVSCGQREWEVKQILNFVDVMNG